MKYKNRELKKMARIALNGRWIYPILLSLIYTIIIMALSAISSLFGLGTTTYAKILSWVATVIVSLISGLFGAGVSYAYLNLCRGKTSTLKDLFAAFRMNPDRFLIVSFIMSIPTFLSTLPTYLTVDVLEYNFQYSVLLLITNIVVIVMACFFCLSNYLLLDFPEMGAFEALYASIRLMKGNKGRYLALSFSFAGWILLSIFTFFVSLIWIEPYMHMTMAFFYSTILSRAGIYPAGEEPVIEEINESITADSDFETDLEHKNEAEINIKRTNEPDTF